ncbi:MAG: tetratricopeptide repeat protein [Phycisphaeraceae bacterium]|nr:tetratricopeptide repeat protein [Phycisphaeraceae bacterium]
MAFAREAFAGPPAPPPGVPESDVRVHAEPELAARSLAEVLELLGPLAPPQGPGVAPLDPDGVDAAEVRRLLERARESLGAGKLLKAIVDLEAATARDPGDLEALRLLAQAFTQVGNDGRALNAYERILIIKPDDPQALMATGTAAAAQRQYKDAIRRIAGALLAAERNGTPLTSASRVIGGRVLGGVLREIEFDVAAIEAWRDALVALDELEAARHLDPNAAAQDTTRLRAELLLARADAMARLSRWADALEELEVIKELPGVDHDVVLPRELYLLEAAGRREEAEARLAETLAQLQEPSAREVDLARWLVSIDATRPALIERARLMARERPQSILAVQFLGEVDPKQAREAFEQLLAASPGDDVSLRGWFDAAGDSDPDARAKALVERLEATPEFGMAATIAALSGAVDERSLRTALRALPDSPSRAAAEVRLAALGRDFGSAWTTVVAARAKAPDDLGLAIAQLEVAGALEEASLIAKLESGAPGTAEGLPPGDEVERAAALALRAAGELDLALARLEALDARGVRGAASARAKMLADRVALLRADDPTRQELALTALRRATAALEQNPTDDEAAVVMLRLLDPRQGAAADAESWTLLRAKLRRGPMAWLDERVSIEEDIARGRAEQAVARLEALAQARPFDGEIVGLAVNLMARSGRGDEAIAWLEREREARPGLVPLRDALLAARVQAGQSDAVLEELRRAMVDDPDDALLTWHFEAVLRALGRREEAATRSRERLLARPPGVRRSLELANLEQRADRPGEALEALRSVLEAPSIGAAQRLAAVEIASRLPNSIPGRSRVLIELAEPGLAEGGPDAVLYAAAAAVGTMEDARGGSLNEQREAVERVAELARRAAATSAGASGDLAMAMRWRDSAQMFIDTGFPQAAGVFLRARLEDPSSLPPVALRALQAAAFASDAETRDQAEESIALFRALRGKGIRPFEWARDVGDDEASALVQLATLYSMVGDREGSERLLEEAILVQPDHAMALNNLAWSRLERGLLDARTVELAERALAGAPEEAAILDTLGWVRYMQGQLADRGDGTPGALTLLRRSVAVKQQEPSLEVLDHLGDALWASGDRDGAIESWRKVVRISSQQFDRAKLLPQLGAYLIGECGLRLADPEGFYEEHFGRPTQRAARKLADVEAGRAPMIATPQVAGDGGDP